MERIIKKSCFKFHKWHYGGKSVWLKQSWSAAQSAQVGGDLTFPFPDWTEPGVSLHSPMTIRPSFPPPFAPSSVTLPGILLSIQRKHFSVCSLVNQCSVGRRAIFKRCVLIEQDLFQHPRQPRLSSARTRWKLVELITVHVYAIFIAGHDRAALKVQSYEACGEYLDPFSADQAQYFPCGLILHVWRFYTTMSILAPLSPWSARQWVKYTLVF